MVDVLKQETCATMERTVHRRKQHNINKDFDYLTRVDYNFACDNRSIVGKVVGDPLPEHAALREKRRYERE